MVFKGVKIISACFRDVLHMASALPLFVPHLFFFWCIGKAVFCDCCILAHLSRRLTSELIIRLASVVVVCRLSSVVHRPSSVVCSMSSVNIFKHLLFWNHWADWNEISCGACMGSGNKSLFVRINFCMGKSQNLVFFQKLFQPVIWKFVDAGS